jgi:aminopeptidase N
MVWQSSDNEMVKQLKFLYIFNKSKLFLRWNDLWLNEGFATYVEYVGTDHAEKQFQMVKN